MQIDANGQNVQWKIAEPPQFFFILPQISIETNQIQTAGANAEDEKTLMRHRTSTKRQ